MLQKYEQWGTEIQVKINPNIIYLQTIVSVQD